MENYYEHLLAPDGNQEFAKYIIGMLDDLNYGLVRVKINGKKVTNIQIMAENDQHTLSLKDCEILNADFNWEIDIPINCRNKISTYHVSRYEQKALKNNTNQFYLQFIKQ